MTSPSVVKPSPALPISPPSPPSSAATKSANSAVPPASKPSSTPSGPTSKTSPAPSTSTSPDSPHSTASPPNPPPATSRPTPTPCSPASKTPPTDTPAQLAEKEALRAQFIGKLIPSDFVQDLRADRDAIGDKTLTNTTDNLQGLESTESINVLLLEGSQEVTRLDAMMQNLYRRHPAKLHAWLAASRVERSPQRNKDTRTLTVATTPPAPQP